MSDHSPIDPSMIIIEAGFAGLSAGIYAQMNGYQTQIFEMGDLPGGLCTAWKRKGYTKELAQDNAAYEEKKDQVARTVVSLLEERFPGIGEDVEMIDVATPLTFERYTGNWQGSFEGWQITPANSQTVMKPMSQTLPGLSNFAMCGQWVEPGGGLPTGVTSGRRLVQSLCKQDGKEFVTKED